ncbi:hypothetical protein IAT40_006376 [Kwoniella sp. CBS 6097]
MGTHNSSSAALSSLDPSTIKQPPGSRGDTHSSYALSTLKDTHTINHGGHHTIERFLLWESRRHPHWPWA